MKIFATLRKQPSNPVLCMLFIAGLVVSFVPPAELGGAVAVEIVVGSEVVVSDGSPVAASAVGLIVSLLPAGVVSDDSSATASVHASPTV